MAQDAHDAYCYPGTTVLRNRAGLRDRRALDRFEAAMVAINLAELRERPITLDFGVERLRETHRRIFVGVYDWAGELRENTGRMHKERNGYVVTYADSAHLAKLLSTLIAQLQNEQWLQGSSVERFAARAAHYYGELDALHPFREGNSRTLRLFTSDLAQLAGPSDELGRHWI